MVVKKSAFCHFVTKKDLLKYVQSCGNRQNEFFLGRIEVWAQLISIHTHSDILAQIVVENTSLNQHIKYVLVVSENRSK